MLPSVVSSPLILLPLLLRLLTLPLLCFAVVSALASSSSSSSFYTSNPEGKTAFVLFSFAPFTRAAAAIAAAAAASTARAVPCRAIIVTAVAIAATALNPVRCHLHPFHLILSRSLRLLSLSDRSRLPFSLLLCLCLSPIHTRIHTNWCDTHSFHPHHGRCLVTQGKRANLPLIVSIFVPLYALTHRFLSSLLFSLSVCVA